MESNRIIDRIGFSVNNGRERGQSYGTDIVQIKRERGRERKRCAVSRRDQKLLKSEIDTNGVRSIQKE